MWRVALLALLAALAACSDSAPDAQPAPAPAAARLWPAPERYALDLTYDARGKTLRGTERIAFVNTSPRALERVWLRLWGNAFGSCSAPFATVRVLSGGTAGARRRGCTALQVRLDEPLAPRARTELRLRLRIRTPADADRFGRFRGAAYFGNAIPLLVVEDRAGPRLPAYAWRGEAFFSLAARWEVALALPQGIRAATTGVRRGDRYVAEHARDFTIVAGRLRVQQLTTPAGIRLRHFSHPGLPAADGRRALAAARGALDRFSRWFGRYDAPELDLVDGPADLGDGGIAMEYPELVLTPAVAPAVAHEVAHQWWWGILGSDQHAEPWLDEGLSEWSASRLPRRFGGGFRFGTCGPVPRGTPAMTSPMDVFERSDDREAYVNAVYYRGACALRRIASAIGAQRLDETLRRIVRERRYGTWTGRDLVAAVRDAAPNGSRIGAVLRREGLSGD